MMITKKKRLLRINFWSALTPLESKITSGACAPSFSGQTQVNWGSLKLGQDRNFGDGNRV